MNENTKAPTWFKIVSITALVWNLMGASAYVMQMTMSQEAFEALPMDQQDYYNSIPMWANGAFAIAVWGGTIASVGLLLKKSFAYPVFILSFVGICVQLINAIFISNSFEVFGPGGMSMPILVFAGGIYLILLSKSAKTKGWIN